VNFPVEHRVVDVNVSGQPVTTSSPSRPTEPATTDNTTCKSKFTRRTAL